MNTKQSPDKVKDDIVVSMDYTLTVEGEIVDSSEGEEPIQFLQGYQNIIPGLESELYGMSAGESKEVTVKTDDAYGESDPDQVMEVDRGEFPPEIPLQPGIELQMTNEDGDVLIGTIAGVGDESVEIDFNHPLAGKDLQFRVTIVGLREATSEELEHGHVHE